MNSLQMISTLVSIFPFVFVLALTIFVLKVFSSQSAVKMKKFALWIVSNLMFLFPAGYILIFICTKYVSAIYGENYLVWGILTGIIMCLFQVVIFAVERYSKGSYEKKVANVSLISLILTMFLMFLFYKEAYFDFQLMHYVENSFTWVLFCLIVYALAMLLSCKSMSKMFLWSKIMIVSGSIMLFVGYNFFFAIHTHSEPHLDSKELFVCTEVFGEHQQYGPWFKKSWRGVCVEHQLCDTDTGEIFGCDLELASLNKTSGFSWQRTNVDFLDITPYSYQKDGFVENPKALEKKHVVSDGYLFHTNKSGGFYYRNYQKGERWIISEMDASNFKSLGGFYFKGKEKIFYEDKELWGDHNTDDVEYLGDNCLRCGEIFYKKGKKVDNCD